MIVAQFESANESYSSLAANGEAAMHRLRALMNRRGMLRGTKFMALDLDLRITGIITCRTIKSQVFTSGARERDA